MIIFKTFTFDAAHYLPNVPQHHKCRQMHGHTYFLKIFLEGELDAANGWVMDYAEIKKQVSPVIELVDHKVLNNVDGLNNPTCEMVTIWLWNRIKPLLPCLSIIELNETPTSGTIYTGA
jgi:6-pyruvoyltetrahydropterin/6-carboxytetrahydropterin synthase